MTKAKESVATPGVQTEIRPKSFLAGYLKDVAPQIGPRWFTKSMETVSLELLARLLEAKGIDDIEEFERWVESVERTTS